MINIPKNELIDSLKQGYLDFQSAPSKEERINIKGWCNALEAIVFQYAPEFKEEVFAIRDSIVSKRSKLSDDIDLDTPSYTRRTK